MAITIEDENVIDRLLEDADPTLDDSTNLDLSEETTIGNDAEGIEDNTPDGTSSGSEDVELSQSTLPDDTTIEFDGEDVTETEELDVPTDITNNWTPVDYTYGDNGEFVNLEEPDDLVDGDTSIDYTANEIE